MRRVVASVAAVVSLVGATDAVAAGSKGRVAAKAVAQTRAAVTTYWTPRACAPRSRPCRCRPPRRAPAPPRWPPGRIPATTRCPPGSAHGKVFFTTAG